jgi:hypothetical protein
VDTPHGRDDAYDDNAYAPPAAAEASYQYQQQDQAQQQQYPPVADYADEEQQQDRDMEEEEDERRFVQHDGSTGVGAAEPDYGGASSGALYVGARVEANYQGYGKWYSGFIDRDNGDGTYLVQYDDGDVETHVDANNIQLLQE